MRILEAIVLGVIQGATEFLPISSSGHLLLVPNLLNWSEPDLNAIAIAHLGTLLAVLIYFRRDLWHIARAVLISLRMRTRQPSGDARVGWNIIVASIPAVLVGLLAADFIDEVLARPVVAAGLLVVTAVFLLLGERRLTGNLPMDELSPGDALFIGIAQVLALLPGISRSGVTISAALTKGLGRSSAARFSFLMGVPAITGAGLFSLLDLLAEPLLADQLPFLMVTLVAAALVGYACIHFLLRWLRKRSLTIFAGYCLLLATTFLLVNWLI